MTLRLFGVCYGARLELIDAALPEGEPALEARSLGCQHLEVRLPDFGFRVVVEFGYPPLREIQEALLEVEQLRVNLGPVDRVIDICGVLVLALEKTLGLDGIQRGAPCFLPSWNRSGAAVLSVRIVLRLVVGHDTHCRVASARAAGGVCALMR